MWHFPNVDLDARGPYGAAAVSPKNVVGGTTLEAVGGRERGIDAFATYASRVRDGLEPALRTYLAEVENSVRHLPRDVQAAVESVRDLTLRGGKRLRAVLLAASYDACGGEGGAEAVVMAGVSLELLQAYLLIHDDWMDEDDVRRGGPSVPAMMRAHFAGRREVGAGSARVAEVFAVLAGDFAAGLALGALARVSVSPDRIAAALHEMGRIQRDVVLGQMCDVQGSVSGEPPTEATVELTHSLKTGSYTVRGPLALGARLAGASPRAMEALMAMADPLGVAFQLRDDVLGTFGDPTSTGKPSTGDLRQGKRTALIATLAGTGVDHDTRNLLSRAFGKPDAPAADLEALVDRIVSSGAKRRVEERIDALLSEAMAALESAPFSRASRELLRGAADTLVHREK